MYVFMPSSSMHSMKNNVFECLPEDQLFEGVIFNNLQEVYSQLLENTENKLLSLLVFDDVQSYLKNKEVELNLLHIINNSRHLRTSIFVIGQTYNKIPMEIRKAFTDMFIFSINKEEYATIFEEDINISKKDFKDVLKQYKEYKKNEPKRLYIFMITTKYYHIHDNHDIK